MINYRHAVRSAAAALCVLLAHASGAHAADPIKLGLVLPYSSVYAQLGEDITRGLELALAEAGGQVAGRSFEVLKQDSQVNPQVGLQVTRKFIQQDKVDFLVGPVASHVAIAMSKAAKDSETFLLIANAGADQLTREQCSPYIFRTSFSNWQPYYPMGPWLVKKQGIKRVAILAPNYAAGKEALAAFKEGFLPAGGEVTSEQYPALGEADYQPFLSKISQGNPQAVFVFFSGSDAVKFVQQYAQAGLKNSFPLYASGYLVEDGLQAQGDAALGIKTTLHWADGLDIPANARFKSAYEKKFNAKPTVFSVQGYDTGQLLVAALKMTGGGTSDKAKLRRALETAVIDSPRGPFKLSAAHNPVQNIYVREVVKGSGGQYSNKVIDVAAESLNDPATGCDMPK